MQLLEIIELIIKIRYFMYVLENKIIQMKYDLSHPRKETRWNKCYACCQCTYIFYISCMSFMSYCLFV